MSDPLTVHAAITAVMADLPAIGKDDKAPGNMGGFSYRGIEAITTALKPLMAKHGLVIIPQARTVTVTHAPGQKEAWRDVTIEFDWLIVGPDGSELTATTVGIGRDHTDKGANKAQSQAFKYLLMALFMISDSAADGDGHDYTGSEAPARNPLVDDTIDKLRALSETDPDVAAGLKDWAHGMDRKLSAQALAEDQEWLLTVRDELHKVAGPPTLLDGDA